MREVAPPASYEERLRLADERYADLRREADRLRAEVARLRLALSTIAAIVEAG